MQLDILEKWKVKIRVPMLEGDGKKDLTTNGNDTMI